MGFMRPFISRHGLVFPVAHLGLLVAVLTGSTGVSTAQETAVQGRVYAGDVGDESRPLADVTLSLFGANNPYPVAGTLIDSTSTNTTGWYQLQVSGGWEFFHIIQTNLDGFESVGATSVDGTVRTPDWIEYPIPLEGKVLTGNKFWDVQPAGPTPTPPTDTPTPTTTPTPTATQTPTPGSGTTVSICAVADAELDQAHPGVNPGDGAELKIGYGQGQNEPFANRVLIRFDLSFVPQGAVIQNADLEMRMIAADGINPVDVGLYTVDQPWDESTVDWDTQPVVGANPAALLNINSATPSVRGWDLRVLVQRWVEGSLENNGVLLRGPEGAADWSRVFDSRHYTTFCPRLVITFAPGDVISTPTPTPTPTRTPTPKPACSEADFGGNTFSSATAISSGQAVEEYICPSGDVDWFKLPIEASQEVSVYLYDLPRAPDADLDVFLVNPSGGVEASSEVYGAHRGGYINHTAYVTGDWRVMVKGKGVADWSPTKTYGLRVDIKFNCDNADEAGDTFQAATGILPTLPAANTIRKHTGYICPQKDLDYYKFSVPFGQNVTISATLSDLSADYDLYLYRPDGDVFIYSKNRGTADEAVPAFTTSIFGDWRVAVKPYDGAYHNRPYTLEVTLKSNADLSVEAIEVTQGIQDLSNGVLLASGKTTVARVYVDPGPAITEASGVEVELHGWYYNYGWKPFPDSPLELGPQVATDHELENAKRNFLSKSFNFTLPKSWTIAGDITLRATVNPQHTVPESDFNNNDRSDVITIRNTAPLNVGLVPITTKGLVPSLKNNADVAQMMTWLRAAYPVGEINIWHMVGSYSMDHDLTEDNDEGCGPGWVDLLADLGDRYDGWTNRPANAVVYGLLSLGVPVNAGGCGGPDRRSAAGLVDPTAGPVIAHEIGHVHFRQHAPSDRDASGVVSNISCTDPGAYSEDAGYPQYTDPHGAPYKRSSIGEVGLNVFSNQIYRPEDAYDFMAYCKPKWVSPYTWERIALSIPVAPKAGSVEEDTRQVLVSGTVIGDDCDFRPFFWVRERSTEADQGSQTGPYTIELRDASGGVIGSRVFDTEDPVAFVDRAMGVFREWIPCPGGVATIALVYQGADIAVREVSAGSPAVTLISPNGGESWGQSGTARIEWATDDDDVLAANVFISIDDGDTWKPLAMNLGNQHYDLDLSTVPGGAAMRVKVEVSDGFNTTSDISDAPFGAEEKAPIPLLFAPETGRLVRRGQGVVMAGDALDLQTGTFDGDGLNWFSSIDGFVGASAEVAVMDLSCGAHEIALEAVATGGMAGIEVADITVHGGCDDRVYVLPASAHVQGLEGTSWVSDIVLHNPNPARARAMLYLLDDGAWEQNHYRLDIGSTQSVILADVLSEAFGPAAESGGVLIASSASLMVSSRTYNDAESGTFGQYVPVEAESRAITGNDPATLIQLTRNADYRTNIGLTNLGQSELTVAIDLFSSAGAYLGSKGVVVDPYSFKQVTDILGKIGSTDVDDAYAEIRADGIEASFFTYASIIDNRTGDPVYASPIETSTTPVYIPAAAHLRGANRTNWRTDLEVYNSGDIQAQFQVDLLERDQQNSNPQGEIFLLAPGRSVRYEDVLDTVFSYSGAAALRITPIKGTIAATSRTYNLLEDGTMGQFTAAVRAANALEMDEEGRLIQLSQSTNIGSGFRTNVGLTSVSSLPMVVHLDLYDGDGSYLGRISKDLDPYEHTQIDKIFAKLTHEEVENGFVVVHPEGDGARLLTYASVIDNRSADPIYIPARTTPSSGLWQVGNKRMQPAEVSLKSKAILAGGLLLVFWIVASLRRDRE